MIKVDLTVPKKLEKGHNSFRTFKIKKMRNNRASPYDFEFNTNWNTTVMWHATNIYGNIK